MRLSPAAAAAAAALCLCFAAGALLAHADRPAPVSEVILHDLDGQRAGLPLESAPLLVNFWATWCPPCRHELPLLEQAAGSDQARFAVVAVAVDGREAASGYWRQGGFTFPTLIAGLEAGPRLLAEYGNAAASMPYTVLLDGSGQVIASRTGAFASVDEIVSFASGR